MYLSVEAIGDDRRCHCNTLSAHVALFVYSLAIPLIRTGEPDGRGVIAV